MEGNGLLCEGGTIALSINGQIDIPPGVTPVFEWYFQNTNNPIGTTATPDVTIPNASAVNNGLYFVSVISGNCSSLPSNAVNIEVGSNPEEIANAGSDQTLCAENTTLLAADLPQLSSAFWSSPSGATIADISDPNTVVSNLLPGENIFVWSLHVDGCDPFHADTVLINYSDSEPLTAFAGEDIELCEETVIQLGAPTPIDVTGQWTQPLAQSQAGIVLTDPAAPDAEAMGLEPGHDYTFYWTIYDAVCDQYSEDEIIVSVSEIPGNNAIVPESLIYACSNETTTITAIAPSIGSGSWSTNSGASISNPEEAVVVVGDLPSGTSEFVWSLSNAACQNYDTDTLFLINEEKPTANAESYTTPFQESIYGKDILANDLLGDIEFWSISVIEAPDHGSLSENIIDGIMDYTPDDRFSGTDEFVYNLCNLQCPADCDTAIVRIEVNENTELEDCWIPDVITPNEDGYNDVFKIPCLVDFPDNEISVYNRWGDKVFETKAYQNDWAGTYRNSKLPPGTYYFFLRLKPESKAIKGFLTLVR